MRDFRPFYVRSGSITDICDAANCSLFDHLVDGGEELRIAGCCARAASGHAAAPPSSVMKSRRLMQAVI
jgi:hypothetical protein